MPHQQISVSKDAFGQAKEFFKKKPNKHKVTLKSVRGQEFVFRRFENPKSRIVCGYKHNELDRGAFGKVVIVVDENSNRYALKVAASDRDDLSEAQVLLRLGRLHGHKKVTHKPRHSGHNLKTCKVKELILQDLIAGESLDKWLIKNKRNDEGKVLIALELIKEVQKLHKLNYVHRDIKPENVMVNLDTDGKYTVRLIDFGLSRMNDHTTSNGGTPAYMPPELYGIKMMKCGRRCLAVPHIPSHVVVNNSHDIFSLGLVLKILGISCSTVEQTLYEIPDIRPSLVVIQEAVLALPVVKRIIDKFTSAKLGVKVHKVIDQLMPVEVLKRNNLIAVESEARAALFADVQEKCAEIVEKEQQVTSLVSAEIESRQSLLNRQSEAINVICADARDQYSEYFSTASSTASINITQGQKGFVTDRLSFGDKEVSVNIIADESRARLEIREMFLAWKESYQASRKQPRACSAQDYEKVELELAKKEAVAAMRTRGC